jgi:hypothetical protein
MHGCFDAPRKSYRDPSSNDDPRQFSLARAEDSLASAASDIAQRHYPGHPWYIEADIKGGVVKLQLQPFMGPTNFYIIHLASTKNLFVFENLVKRFCGEILERYNVPRCKYDGEMWRAVAANIPVHRKFHGYLPS